MSGLPVPHPRQSWLSHPNANVWHYNLAGKGQTRSHYFDGADIVSVMRRDWNCYNPHRINWENLPAYPSVRSDE